MERLQQEARILWMEQRFFDVSSTRLAKPFGKDWRTLWGVREREGEHWLVHVSNLVGECPLAGACVDSAVSLSPSSPPEINYNTCTNAQQASGNHLSGSKAYDARYFHSRAYKKNKCQKRSNACQC